MPGTKAPPKPAEPAEASEPAAVELDLDAPLLQRVAAAMLQTSAVTKNKRNSDQGYSYASVESMLEEVRGPLHERGVLLLPQITSSEEQTIRSKSGTEGSRVVLEVTFRFLDGKTADTYEITGWKGEGQDYGDKAYGKAYTNAIKTFVRAAWLLPAGDDPEGSDPGERAAKNGGPDWAKPAPKALKGAAVKVLEELVGDRRLAIGYAGTLAEAAGHMPVVVAQWIAALPKWQEMARQASGEAVEPPAEEGDRDVAAEAAQEASGEPEPSESAEDVPEGPSEEERKAALERPPAGTVEVELEEDAPDESKREFLRAAGCICTDPIGPKDELDDACPIQNHGIPF